MRLTILLTLVLTLTVSAGTYSQNTKLNLSLENATIEQVLLEIENTSKFIFIYESGTIDKSTIRTISVKNQTIDAILTQLLEGTDVNYTIDDRQVLLYKEDSPLSTINQLRVPSVQAQQSKSVSGKVTDSSGSTMPGVSVVIKGTNKGTITDMDGKFTLTNVPGNAKTLLFSFVGMKFQEVPIGNKVVFTVVLEEESVGIEEVIAIGYGTMKKIDMTGSASSVQAKEIVKAPVKSFDEALAGRIAGVQVSSNDGQPGSLPQIIIRGANSLTQDNTPLYVIDGFPMEGNDNNSINPNDIESIDILKDASATAIYGARGANGVIIITTKRGKSGAPVITYDGYYGINKDIKRIEMLNPYEFVKLQLELSGDPAKKMYLTDENRTLDDYKNIKGIDWFEKVLQIAPMQSHNLSVSGGNDKSKYSISGSMMDQDGIFINTGFKRFQGRVTLDQTINDKLKIGINTNYSDSKSFGTIATSNGGSTTASLMYSVWASRPILTGPSTEDINYEDALTDPIQNTANEYRINPFVQMQNELRESLSSNLLANAYLEYMIIKGLNLRITGGTNLSNTQNNAFNNSKTRTGAPAYPQSLGPNGSEQFSKSTNFTNENTLSYSKVFHKDHSLNVVAGYTQQTGKVSYFGASSVQIANESIGLSGLDEGTPRTIASGYSNWNLQSFLSRVNYSYKSKYLLTASIRADASSKFAKGHRWGYFPSVAFAYRISNESFMKAIEFISDAKFRVSYGITGNNRVSDFAYLSGMTTNSSSGYSFDDGIPSRGMYAGTLGNPLLKWETTTQFNVGGDLSFFKNRLSFTGDYYEKRTDDLLLNAQLPSISGYSSAFMNIGSVSNNGIELTVNTVNVLKQNFKWRSSINISFNRSKVLALTKNQESLTSVTAAVYNGNPVYIAKVGQPIAQFYGLIYDGPYPYSDFNKLTNGKYVLKDEVPTNGASRTSIQPGNRKYRDINKDGIISLNDFTVIGDPNPDFIGGLNNSFEYKGFDLSILFQFSYGNDVFNANRVVFEAPVVNCNLYATYLNRWSDTNQTSDIPTGGNTGFYDSRTVEDASFLRLKTVSLGYTFSSKLLQTVNIKSLRIYTSAQNLYTLTNYSGIDPEVSTRHSTLTPGFDYSPYPRARTLVFGLNMSF